MWHGKFTWSFHLELGFHKYIHMNIYIYAWKLQGINLCLEISSCETGPALMHSNQTYNMCISWVPLVCDVVDWFYLRHEAMADQAIRCHPRPLQWPALNLAPRLQVQDALSAALGRYTVQAPGTRHKVSYIAYFSIYIAIHNHIYITLFMVYVLDIDTYIFIYIWSTYHSLGICILYARICSHV